MAVTEVELATCATMQLRFEGIIVFTVNIETPSAFTVGNHSGRIVHRVVNELGDGCHGAFNPRVLVGGNSP